MTSTATQRSIAIDDARRQFREMRADLRMAVWRAGEIARALWHAARHPAG